METEIEAPIGHRQEGIAVAVVSVEGRVCNMSGLALAARDRPLLSSVGRWVLGEPVGTQNDQHTHT